MITTENLSKTFYDRKKGEIRAVTPTTLEINKGEIFGLLGPNGAGKTTFLRMLATVITPTGGSAMINGYHLQDQSEEIKKSIGFISGDTKLYGRLTPKELLCYFGELYDMRQKQIESRCEAVFQMLDMSGFINQRIESLSTGQTQKTSIARCILHDPPIFIMDEPTLGLDVLTSRTILQFIQNAAQEGKTIILSTHYMQEAELLCKRIGFLHLGKIMAIDTLKGFQQKCNKNHLAEIFLNYVAQQEDDIHEV